MREPEPVQETEHVWIPMPDGVRLSARIWRPVAPAPVPAVLEYIPYRKRDLVRARDARTHPFLAGQGYACLRVDMRGSGDSEGSMPDMYAADELHDARHVIDWIAAQPWCSGRVGMFGTSWGGTASLQAAVDAPGPLCAVLANCATIDRFEDDIHWMGGCVLTDSLEWGATLPAILATPPDSATVGPGWMDQWQARLDALTHPLEHWLQHAVRGRYWRHGSVRFAADRLSCPVLTVGGWADRYANSVMRLVAARPDICWGIVGPWGHHYPDQGEPGPAMGFQQLALAWWDHWLRGDGQTGPDWPRLRLWRREADPPQDRLLQRKGAWFETDSASPGAGLALDLSPGCLTARPAEAPVSQCAPSALSVPCDPRHGQAAGDTGYFGRMGGLPLDQSDDDARCLGFETGALSADTDLYGHAALRLTLRRDGPEGQLVCRLCDITPEGRAVLVTRTVLNLARDAMLDADRPHDPAQPQRHVVDFPATHYRFRRGHRIRLSLGASYWPLVWPATRQAPLHLVLPGAVLDLPAPPAETRPLRAPLPPALDLPRQRDWQPLSDGPLCRLPQEVAEGVLRSGWRQPPSGARFDGIGVAITSAMTADYAWPLAPGAQPRCTMQARIHLRRPDGSALVTSALAATGTEAGLDIDATLDARWNDTALATRRWRYTS